MLLRRSIFFHPQMDLFHMKCSMFVQWLLSEGPSNSIFRFYMCVCGTSLYSYRGFVLKYGWYFVHSYYDSFCSCGDSTLLNHCPFGWLSAMIASNLCVSVCAYTFGSFLKRHTHTHTHCSQMLSNEISKSNGHQTSKVLLGSQWCSSHICKYKWWYTFINNKIYKFYIDCLTLVISSGLRTLIYFWPNDMESVIDVLTQPVSNHFYRFWYITLKKTE